MYKRRTVLEVQDWGDKWQVVYVVEHVPETPEETLWAEQSGHCFPKDVFEWRAAEYGIDPTDMTTLLDIVLAEAFLEPKEFAPGESLHDAPTIEVAREAHLRRCAKGKLKARVSSRAAKDVNPTGPLHAILTSSPMDLEALDLKKKFVHSMRQEFARRVSEPEDRIETLRKGLKRRNPDG